MSPDVFHTTTNYDGADVVIATADNFVDVCFSYSTLSSKTPTSRTVVDGFMMLPPTNRLQSALASFTSLERMPNHASCVLASLSFSRRDVHHSRRQ